MEHHCKDTMKAIRTTLTGLLMAGALQTSAAQASVDMQKTYPAHVFTRNVDKGEVLLVEKTSKTAYLVDLDPKLPRTARRFDHLMVGENAGRKQKQGDKRTPEGVYEVQTFLPEQALDRRYGSGAFPLDYPNPIDRLAGRNGGGIWLHGRDDADKAKWATHGCVAFNNQDIRALSNVLSADTPVVIASRVEFVDRQHYKAERTRVMRLLDDFINAWQDGDFKRLDRLLDPRFRGVGGLDKQAWLARKARIHAVQGWREIDADKVVALKDSDEQVVFDFEQSYCATHINSRGRKRLYFRRDGKDFRLVSEKYTALPARPADPEKVRRFIQHWLGAWNRRDLGAYIASYADDFRDTRHRDLKRFREYKAGIFRSRPEQRVRIEDLRIEPLDASRFRVRFVQHYSSREYNDTGRKTLIVSGCGNHFRIERETWNKL